MPENSSARPTNLITVGVLVIALAAVFFVGKSLGDDDSSPAASNSTETFGIVTSGEGKMTAVPDQLSFSASVSHTQQSTAAAMDATNRDIRAITTAAKKAGVAAKDIQSTSLSIHPKYDYSSRSRKLIGYTSTQRVRIMVRKLDKAGKTVGDVTNATGNNSVSVSSISLSFSNQAELIAQARTKAVKKSKAAAVALAKAAGRDVGELEYVAEVAPQQYGYGYNRLLSADSAFAGAVTKAELNSAVPFSPGKSSLSVTVQVRWSLAE
jgi:uncharacterized protein YggE